MIYIVYIVVGAFTGVIAGLMGIGGGIIVVPSLLFIFVWQAFPPQVLMHMAVATSLATMVFTSMMSTYSHHRRGAVLWQKVMLLTPGILIGSALGAMVVDYLSSDILRIGFAIFLLLLAVHININKQLISPHRAPANAGLVVVGSGIGGISTILGIGGGTLTVPLLLWSKVSMRNAIATAAACGFPIAFFGSMILAITSWNHQYLPAGTTGYIYWPAVCTIALSSIAFAPLGAKLAHSLPVKSLRRIFAVILVIVAIRMII